ncbi:hypothetical protein BGAL_0357g00080 [Botrytis galanthina]|uniref:Intradiol ring-cleavage dioxygenases domain-containing protein n=1 Tax=Botrytis galanthina TaxID=278940 RepID=A0A4S8QSH9_9HELO|nr:hypothetical protein BGAL_0357g00080 [Botrytis galanthina]
MIYSRLLSKLAAAACVFHISTAHPGQTVQELQDEIVERDIFFEDTKTSRDLSHCADILRKRGAEDRNRERIAVAVAKARADLGLLQKKTRIKARATSPLSISHLSGLDVTPTTPNVEEIIYSNSSCILSLEGETGPFYVSGEHIRSDLRETQAGVPVILDGQFLDTTTCEPTFLRGLQPTDANGVAQFTSLFPGHYAGRTTHMHVVAHIGGTVLPNGTYTGGKVSHIGQVFFDQRLITKVEALPPYDTNTQRLTTNSADRVVAAEIAGGSDPFFNYVLLGDTVSDGIFAWITFGVNQGATYTASAAARLTANGGVPIAGGGRPPIA